jgi:hypothetical protein
VDSAALEREAIALYKKIPSYLHLLYPEMKAFFKKLAVYLNWTAFLMELK